MKIALFLAGMIALVGACDAGAESYDDVEAVVEAMEDEGIECEDLQTTSEFSNESDSLVAERGLCMVDDERVVVSMFENAADRDDWVAVGKLFGQVAVGENWVVGSDSSDLVQRIADELDATIPTQGSDEED